jgi:hypothetical protein
MLETCMWALVVGSGVLVGGVVGMSRAVAMAASDVLLVYVGEVLALTVGISLANPETDQELGGYDPYVVGLAMIAGGLVMFAVSSRLGRVLRRLPVDLGRRHAALVSREVALRSPQFVALGVLAHTSEFGVDVVFVFAVFLSSVVQALPTSVVLLQTLGTRARVAVTWLVVTACLVVVSATSYVLCSDASITVYGAILGLAAGAILTALIAAEPRSDLSRGASGMLASIRFGLAFLLVALLTH